MPKTMQVTVGDGSKIIKRTAVSKAKPEEAVEPSLVDSLEDLGAEKEESPQFSREYLMGLSMDDLRALIPQAAVDDGVKDTSKKGLIDEFLTWTEMQKEMEGGR